MKVEVRSLLFLDLFEGQGHFPDICKGLGPSIRV